MYATLIIAVMIIGGAVIVYGGRAAVRAEEESAD